MLQEVIDTELCASALYARLESVPGKILLDDSARGLGQRFSILGIDPRATLTVQGRRYIHRRRGGGLQVASNLAVLARSMLQELRDLGAAPLGEKVFAGGLMGYLGYELNDQFEDIPATNPADSSLPDAVLAAYDIWLEIDESQDNRVRILSLDSSEDAIKRIAHVKDLIKNGPALPVYTAPEKRRVAQSNLSKDVYLGLVEKIRQKIRAGDVYQVNLTQRFLTAISDSPIAVFEHIRQQHPAPLGALMEWGRSAISSHSPESFLRLDGARVETRPIKGTTARAKDPAEDERQRRLLEKSEKDRAELAMIVDLMRNDLSRVCRPASVSVINHAQTRSVPTVHHLVSQIRGRLKEGADFFDLLKASWPGGSITGAPKIAAMKVINELEHVRRGPYTGSMGYVSIDDRAEWSIAIRTLVLENGYARIHGGGGIVIDSDPEHEYAESVVKVAGILDALDTDLVTSCPMSSTVNSTKTIS